MFEKHHRPDPDALLEVVQAEEERRRRGRLKIFLGYAAGVGKTYAMLEAAQQRQEEGVGVVVGYVDTHGRAETDVLLHGLEVLPRRQITYRGVILADLDLDAVLARNPELVLVDELAHTNAPEMRHTKRYLDVDELLSHGIDVYTTLNIQHLESLNDVVAQITGVTVRETVPDRVLDDADEIELVDLPPDELLQRLREGKVYHPEQAQRAAQEFFRKGNLTALREIVMRRAANRVDEQMRRYMVSRAIPGPWPAGERLLVAVSPGPLGERLVRATRRLADQLSAEWFALYAETPHHAQLSEADRDRLAHTLRLAEELGARTIWLPTQSVSEAVAHYARSHNITKIVVGEPLRPLWIRLLRGSTADRIVRQSGNIDVQIVTAEEPPVPFQPFLQLGRKSVWEFHLLGLLLVALATALGGIIEPLVQPANLVMVYLLAVVITAVRWGRGPAITASIASVFAFDFFFVPPRYTFAVQDLQYVLTFAALLIVGLVISTLASRAREQADAARRQQLQTTALYDLSRELAASSMLWPTLGVVTAYLHQTFGYEATILLPEGTGLVIPQQTQKMQLGEDEMAVAQWCFRNGHPAGRGTDTLPAADAAYFPLKTARGTIGVTAVLFPDPDATLAPEQRRLLEAAVGLSAIAIERVELAESARRVQLMQETERLQTALLTVIANDLRTPLTSVTEALNSLRQDGGDLGQTRRRDLEDRALEGVLRLNRLVGNLVDMTRIDAGAVNVAPRPTEVREIVTAALHELGDQLEGREIDIDIPVGSPPASVDPRLIARVLVNVLDNALKYAPVQFPITIKTTITDSTLELRVHDRGTGIPPGDLDRIFDKFYRVKRPDNPPGTGLGLFICRGLIEAHGGHIRAENNPAGGATIIIDLPVGNETADEDSR